MNCEKASELILSGNGSGPDLEAHLAKCQDCACLARQWKALRSVKCDLKASPSKEADLKIRSAALARAQDLQRRKSFFKVAMYFAAAAAMLVLSVSLAFAVLNGDSSAASSSSTAKAASSPRFSPAQISWDSVEMADGLLSLSSEIEKTASGLNSASKRQATSASADSDDSSIPKISVEIPDLAT